MSETSSPARASRLETLQMTAYRGLASLAQAMPAERESYPQWTMQVTTVADPAPGLRRITFTAEEFGDFTPLGLDEYFGLLTPPPGGSLMMPDPSVVNARRAVAALPEHTRPTLRWFTIARHRPEAQQIDVDFVRHDHGGPAAAWARGARPDDRVGFRTGTACYRLPGSGEHHLLVGDETALPTAAAAVERARRTTVLGRLDIVLEVPCAGDFPVPTGGGGVTVTVLDRGDAAPGTRVLPHLARELRGHRDHVWACGEQSLAAGVRRLVVRRGHAQRREVMFSGYWRVGRPRL